MIVTGKPDLSPAKDVLSPLCAIPAMYTSLDGRTVCPTFSGFRFTKLCLDKEDEEQYEYNRLDWVMIKTMILILYAG